MKNTKTAKKVINNLTIVRREVMTLAQVLNKTYRNLSLACKQAWAIIKGRKVYTNVAGVSYNNRKAVLAQVVTAFADKAEIHTRLEREPNNEYDKNAIKVNVYFGSIEDTIPVQLGYLPADLAKKVAPIMDKGIEIKPHIYKTESWTAKMVVWFAN